MTTIAFRTEYLTLPDADGKPLGTDAALFLSQITWMAEHCADAEGWFEWSQADCEEQTGLSDFKQYRIRLRLEDAGYLIAKRRGIDGRLQYQSVPAKLGNQQERFPNNSETVERGVSKIRKPEPSVPAKLGNQQERFPNNSETTITLQEKDSPLDAPKGAIPPQGAKTQKFKPPECEEVVSYIVRDIQQNLRGSIADAEKFFDHFQANGWRTNAGLMKDWQSAARNWMRRALEYEARDKANGRGSPIPAKNANAPPLSGEEVLKGIYERTVARRRAQGVME